MGGTCSVACVSVLALAAGAGCQKTWQAQITQPNPLASPTETLRHSEEIVIVTGDMELSAPRDAARPGSRYTVLIHDRYPLQNKASFTVVSRDRVRVHVQLEHKWKEYVDARGWHAYLVDDRGNRYEPVAIDRAEDEHVVMMWDYETHSVRRNAFGDIVAVNDDGHLNRNPLGSLSVFRGTADFVFYSRDIFRPELRWLTFVIERRDLRFKFTWKFTDERIARGAPAGRVR